MVLDRLMTRSPVILLPHQWSHAKLVCAVCDDREVDQEASGSKRELFPLTHSYASLSVWWVSSNLWQFTELVHIWGEERVRKLGKYEISPFLLLQDPPPPAPSHFQSITTLLDPVDTTDPVVVLEDKNQIATAFAKWASTELCVLSWQPF